MSAVDIIILVILVIFGIIGFGSGLKFGAPFVLAVIGSRMLSGMVTNLLSMFINTDGATMSIIAFIITFIVLMILLKRMAYVLENLVLFDAIGGAVFGALKGMLLINIVVFTLNSFGISIVDINTISNSSVYGFVNNYIDLNIGYSRSNNYNYEIDDKYAYSSKTVSDGAPSIMPVKMSEIYSITSQFGNRIDPVTRETKFHGGVDFAGPMGTDIYATADGVVSSYKISNQGYGNNVIIDHGNGFKTRYAHLSHINVMIGDNVRKGQKIGAMGSTGKSTGSHLHYEVIKDNKRIDPKYFY